MTSSNHMYVRYLTGIIADSRTILLLTTLFSVPIYLHHYLPPSNNLQGTCIDGLCFYLKYGVLFPPTRTRRSHLWEPQEPGDHKQYERWFLKYCERTFLELVPYCIFSGNRLASEVCRGVPTLNTDSSSPSDSFPVQTSRY